MTDRTRTDLVAARTHLVEARKLWQQAEEVMVALDAGTEPWMKARAEWLLLREDHRSAMAAVLEALSKPW